ncbi:MAG: DUF4157 domain-containing protein [Aquabacterium sp.]|uniref:eCIS core domain-containing protein n=1 Tax=Aquabacterium sp. TaxID=1872578 RepID=UPI0025C42BD7|nr:DUF4157 domain-containing protein [Aquabacterium sp.]MBI5926628.1 DUF4157 domain-containing protein [Aquabacterium sp.]
MSTLTRQLIQRAPDTRQAVAAPVRAPSPVAAPTRPQVPANMTVSQPGDAGEREAARVAQRVVSMPAAPQSATAARFAGAVPGAKGVAGAGQAAAAKAAPAQAASPMVSGGGGQPLPVSVRRFMEPRFGADFSGVRIHTDDAAAAKSRELNAAAFTTGNQIFFAKGAYQPESSEGRELIAHELTHTIQQGAAPQKQAQIQRSVDTRVTERSNPGSSIQRLGVSDAIDYFADKANFIPGFRMMTLILGFNPISGQNVDRSAGNILRALIELLPGGALVTQALDNHGIVDKVANWAMQQLATLAGIGQSIRQAVRAFVDGLSWRDIFSLGSLWDRAVRLVTEPIDRVLSFVRGLITGIITFIKDAILRPIAGLAQGTRGYDLLCAVLGFDPVTGDAVARTPATLIGGFMKLIGREDIWDNIQKGNAIGRAMSWFQTAMAGLMGFVRQIPQLFITAFTSLQLADIILVPRAFARIVGVFGSFVGQFIAWAGETTWNLLEIIFSVVAPNVLVYLKRAGGALRTILNNPIGFIGNLVRAGVTGLRQFASRFLTHLRGAIIGWLTGALGGAGIYIPQALTLVEIFKFVASVLGLTWANIREKLVKATSETAVRAMELGVDIVVALVRGGPAAAWGQLMETLGNLREMVMEQIMAFVSRNIVEAAIVKLVSMLNPAGAFIQAIIAIYNTIMFFVERLQQIAQVAMAVIDSIAAIAAGSIGAAANKVESTLAGLLTLAISFLARLMGLGRVSDAIRNVVERVRAPINAAIDRVIGWIVGLARRVVGAVKSGVQSVLNWAGIRKPLKVDNESHNLYIQGEGAQRRVMMASDPAEYKKTLEKVKIKDSDPKAKDKEKAKAGALATLDKLNDAMTKAAKGGPDGAKAAEGIDALMGELALLTVQFMSKAGAGKSTPPIYGGTGPGGFGVTVGVEKLTEDHEAGSGPSASSGEWEALASRKDGGSTYYVRGHLLNDNLGGTGAEWQNLAPLTQATNNRSAVSMLRTFENTVKNAVLNDKKTVNLTVTMSYGQPGRQADADKVKKSWTPKADADQIAKIIAAEAHVPSSVNCVAHEVADDGSRKALVQSSVANVIDTNLDHYSLGGVARKPMNINVASKAQLMTLAGVSDAVADTIMKERKKRHFADRDDALARLGGTVWHAMVSTAGVSIRCE